MRVIKPGDGRRGWARECVCTGKGNGNGGCGAVLLVEEPDLFTTHTSAFDGSSETFVTFQCAQCGVLTDMDGVPGDVARRLPSQAQWRKKPQTKRLTEGRGNG